jgi:tetratricopeptide (TPR) repeat protein/tRNA A-37 threonylcarbamoyl transferase component Bud32
VTIGLRPGDACRHYRILDRAPPGRPGTGWLAFDERLERRVHVRTIELGAALDQAAAEACLARIGRAAAATDPRLVTVHDGWLADGRLHVAREWVDGATLRGAIAGAPLAPDRAARVFAEVASALASLHDAGLCHGDLRAEQIFLEKHDRVRVADHALLLSGSPSAGDDLRALCETLREAVTGAQPPPRWLVRVLERGLDAPHASARELTLALEHTPRRARRRAVVAAVVVAAATATGVGVGGVGPAPTDLCAGSEAEIARVFGPAHADRIERAFLATGLPFSASSHHSVRGRLDALAADWVSTRTGACEATHVDGIQSETTLERRMACLERRRDEIAAVVAVLETADADTVRHAVELVQGPTAPSSCSAWAVEPGESGDDELRAELASARAQQVAGHYDRALSAVVALEERVRARGATGLLAEVLTLRGMLVAKAGDPAAGRELLLEAVRAAWRAGHDRAAIRAWLDLVFVEGDLLAHQDDAQRAVNLAAATIERIGGDDDALAELWGNEGVLHIDAGRFERAIDRLQAAIALREAERDPDPTRIGSDYNNLGNAYHALRRFGDAEAAYARAAAVWQPVLGEAHPDVASLHNNLGAVAWSQGKMDVAARELELAHRLREAALGADHPLVGATIENRGMVAASAGDHETALAHYRKSLEIKGKSLPPDHPALWDASLNIGTALQDLGRPAEALDAYRTALAGYRKVYGDTHPTVALALHNQGRALRALDRPAEAIPLLERALAIRLEVYGPDHEEVSNTREHLELAHAEAADR